MSHYLWSASNELPLVRPKRVVGIELPGSFSSAILILQDNEQRLTLAMLDQYDQPVIATPHA